VRHARETIVRCWECEAPTDRPTLVTLRLKAGHLSPLMLCPGCYRACYLPLAPNTSEALDVATATVARPLP
jgi:hypothetical protein